jgi:hypothetical protein
LKPAKTNANPIGAATIANPVKLKYTILKIIPDFYTDLRPGFRDPESGTRIPGPGVRDPDPGTRMRESKFTAEPCKDMLKNKYTQMYIQNQKG